MKIGYLVPSCAVSGGMAVVCQHGNRLLNRGHSVVFLSTAEVRPMDWFPNQRVPVHNAASWEGGLDVVVATGWNTAYWLHRIDAKVKCYFVQSDETRFHSEGSRWQHLATLTYYLGVNYLTEARWIRNWLKENFGHDAELVPNGLDAAIFYPDKPIQPKGRKPRILLEGAIGLPYKGMREAFEAVRNVDAEVWCVSSYGAPSPEWKCDRFFEHVPMFDMRKVYSSCDILLKLSRVEGFFGPPMEMMACGGAVVVGRVTGYDEYIVDGVNALVVDAFDVAAAERAIQTLIDNGELRAKLIAGGRITAESWNWEKSIDVLERYYEGLVSGSQAWCGSARRSRYDLSIAYAHGVIARGVLPEEIALGEGDGQIPHHTRLLAARIASTGLFRRVSDILRILYRGYKRVRALFGRVGQLPRGQ